MIIVFLASFLGFPYYVFSIFSFFVSTFFSDSLFIGLSFYIFVALPSKEKLIKEFSEEMLCVASCIKFSFGKFGRVSSLDIFVEELSEEEYI